MKISTFSTFKKEQFPRKLYAKYSTEIIMKISKIQGDKYECNYKIILFPLCREFENLLTFRQPYKKTSGALGLSCCWNSEGESLFKVELITCFHEFLNFNLNIQVFFTKFYLFCFSTRLKLLLRSKPTKNADTSQPAKSGYFEVADSGIHLPIPLILCK